MKRHRSGYIFGGSIMEAIQLITEMLIEKIGKEQIKDYLLIGKLVTTEATRYGRKNITPMITGERSDSGLLFVTPDSQLRLKEEPER